MRVVLVELYTQRVLEFGEGPGVVLAGVVTGKRGRGDVGDGFSIDAYCL